MNITDRMRHAERLRHMGDVLKNQAESLRALDLAMENPGEGDDWVADAWLLRRRIARETYLNARAIWELSAGDIVAASRIAAQEGEARDESLPW